MARAKKPFAERHHLEILSLFGLASIILIGLVKQDSIDGPILWLIIVAYIATNIFFMLKHNTLSLNRILELLVISGLALVLILGYV